MATLVEVFRLRVLVKFSTNVPSCEPLPTLNTTSGKYTKKFSESAYSFNSSMSKVNLLVKLGFSLNSGSSSDSNKAVRTNFSPSDPIFSTNWMNKKLPRWYRSWHHELFSCDWWKPKNFATQWKEGILERCSSLWAAPRGNFESSNYK